MNAHKTTVYILHDNKGQLHMYNFRPTDSYAGRSDRDQYALAQGLHINNPSHDIELGAIDCRIVYSTHSGLQSKPISAVILAKRSFVWDYSKPIGQRESNVAESASWLAILKEYQSQVSR